MAGAVTGRHRGPVAQGIEQQPSKLKVAGSNPAGVATYKTRFNAFNELGLKLANLSPRLANVCSPLFYCEGLSRQLRLINRLCVALNFSQGQVSATGCNLMCRAARFR